MKSKQHWMAFAAIIALGAALGVACGDDPEETSLCAEVECLDAATTCDPVDGICKCGTGDDRITCKSNEICQTEPNPACLQDQCVGVICDGGQTCDPTDGVCKCGADTCSEGQVCSQNRCIVPDPCTGKLCSEGQTCDPLDGSCKCGGETCGDEERCDDGICVWDPCKGVHCGGNSVCNPDDRACHCGTVTGEACKTGESCNEIDGSFTCLPIDLCEDVQCPGGTICDPDFGICRCGGLGPDFPVCNEEQVCHNGECIGGDLCSDVECGPGFECDKDTGHCLCGGSYCTDTETCMTLTAPEEGAEPVFECVQECDPFGERICGDGQTCYVNLQLGASVGYCAPTGTNAHGADCALPHDCVGRSTCYGSGSSDPVCTPICNGDAECQSVEYAGCFFGENTIGRCVQ